MFRQLQPHLSGDTPGLLEIVAEIYPYLVLVVVTVKVCSFLLGIRESSPCLPELMAARLALGGLCPSWWVVNEGWLLVFFLWLKNLAIGSYR